MRRRTLLILCLLLSHQLVAQSLGEVAKKEKERREKNKEKEVSIRVVTEEEISTVRIPETEEVDREEPVDRSQPGESPSSTSTVVSSASDRRRQEIFWRGRVSEARSRLKAAEERYDHLAGLHLTAGEYYVDGEGNPVITSLAQLRRMVTDAKAELEAAQKAMDDLVEEARKAGVPPGWLR